MLKRQPYRNKKYTQAAKDQPCTLNSAYCNYDPSTTVFCHLNESWAGKGMSQKADDFAGFDGCSACHSAYDQNRLSDTEKYQSLLRAVYRTLRNRIDRGIMDGKG